VLESIIAVTGHIGSGKDTLAEIIIRSDPRYERVAFADTLRDVAKLVFGLTDSELNDRVLKEQTLTRWPHQSPRSILQLLGTEAMRSIWPDVWVEAWKRVVKNKTRVIVTDLRFMNEAQAVRDMGGKIVKVIRGGCHGDRHRSEREIDMLAVDYIILNNGSYEDLVNEANRFMRS